MLKMPLIGGYGNDIHGPRRERPSVGAAKRAAAREARRGQREWDEAYREPPPRKVLIGGRGNSIHGPKDMSAYKKMRKWQNRNLLMVGMGGAVVLGAYHYAHSQSSARNGVQPSSSGGAAGM